MIDSFTIFSKTGVVLYHHPSASIQNALPQINYFISHTLLEETGLNKKGGKCKIQTSTKGPTCIAEWDETDTCISLAFYSPTFEDRKDMSWVKTLCQSALKEYEIFHNSGGDDRSLFDATFLALFQRYKRSAVPISTQSQKSKEKIPPTESTKGKKNTVWHDGTAKVTKSALAQLDASKDQPDQNQSLDALLADDSRALREARAAYLPTSEEDDHVDIPLFSSPSSPEEEEEESSYLSSLFSQIIGAKIITHADLDRPLTEMQKRLKSKNVGTSTSTEICNAVRQSLVGTRCKSLTRISTLVRNSLEKIITKMLSSSRNIDLLHAVYTKRDSSPGSPYKIVIIGINGVGKSTTLAKIAFYLKSNGCKPMLAACDTFRSGAVEQLAVHAKCLDVPLFHKGYAKDSSMVAKEAIQHASQNGNDVVLIDTAGRMQNNLPLMKSLSKLVSENQPDCVIFVCEALVGNDGVDQLKMFDAALGSRNVDGIVLTKFDTVSDKVGAVITMTRVTGARVMFVGVGQKYNHLRRLDAKIVVNGLFS